MLRAQGCLQEQCVTPKVEAGAVLLMSRPDFKSQSAVMKAARACEGPSAG